MPGWRVLWGISAKQIELTPVLGESKFQGIWNLHAFFLKMLWDNLFLCKLQNFILLFFSSLQTQKEPAHLWGIDYFVQASPIILCFSFALYALIENNLFSFVILYFLVESAVVFLMYRIQDSIGQDSVFYIVHTTYALFDIATMVISQEYILVNTTIMRLCKQISFKDTALVPGWITLGYSLQKLHCSSWDLAQLHSQVKRNHLHDFGTKYKVWWAGRILGWFCLWHKNRNC